MVVRHYQLLIFKFSQAGLDFNKATNSDLPQICKDTCTEVMKRFNELQNMNINKN